MITPREPVARLGHYRPGRPAGLPQEPLVNLAANENAWGPSPSVQAAIGAGVNWARYPDMAGLSLRDRLGELWHLAPEMLLLGTGSGHLIKCLNETYVGPGDRIAVVFPTFSLYAQGARVMGAEVAVWEGDGHQVDWAGFPDWLRAVRPRLTFLCRPNNPTGDAASDDVVEAALEAVGRDALLVLDEAYIHFAGPMRTGLDWLRAGAPVAVLRTFSKAYGLAAARVGVLAAPGPVIEAVGRVREPFPVAPEALAVAEAALQDESHLAFVVGAVAAGRAQLERELTRRGWLVNPSSANFVWAHPPGPKTAAEWRAGILQQGVLIRDGAGFGVADHLRITVGTDGEVTRLLAAIDGVEEDVHGGEDRLPV